MPARVAWVNVDESDNDPSVLWPGIVAAINAAAEPPDARALPADVPSPRRGGQCFVASLAEIVDRQSDRVWLVPDDFQELRPPEGLRAKGLLLRWMPRNLLVIICSRRYPQVGLHRLRIAGQPREIRAGNLAFSRDEAEDVLASHGVNLPDEALSLSV